MIMLYVTLRVIVDRLLACPHRVVPFQSWCMTGLGAMAGVAGGAASDDEAGQEMSSGAGHRYPSHE
jgi:uncharacterized membrane protein